MGVEHASIFPFSIFEVFLNFLGVFGIFGVSVEALVGVPKLRALRNWQDDYGVIGHYAVPGFPTYCNVLTNDYDDEHATIWKLHGPVGELFNPIMASSRR